MGRRVRRVHGILHAQNARTLRMQTWSIVYDFRPGETDDEVLCEHLNLSLPHLRPLFWIRFFSLLSAQNPRTSMLRRPDLWDAKIRLFVHRYQTYFFVSLCLCRPTITWALLKCIKMIVKCVCAIYLSLCLALGIRIFISDADAIAYGCFFLGCDGKYFLRSNCPNECDDEYGMRNRCFCCCGTLNQSNPNSIHKNKIIVEMKWHLHDIKKVIYTKQ